MDTTIGARVRVLRQLAGLSQRETDRLAGLTRSHTAVIEGRDGDVRSETVAAFGELFGPGSAAWLLGQGDMPTDESVRAAVERARVARASTRPTSPEPPRAA